MKTTLLAGAAVALMAVGLPALAQTAPDAGERPHRMQRADTDGDGRITRDEFVSRRLDRLRAADANADGSVTREEMQAAGQACRAERIANRFDRLDVDNDGSISRTEFEAPRAGGHHGDGQRAGRGGMRGHRGGHGMRRMDGGQPVQPVSIAAVETRLGEAFARLDADSDGALTAAEARAGWREGRGRGDGRRGMRGHRGGDAEQRSPQAPGSE